MTAFLVSKTIDKRWGVPPSGGRNPGGQGHSFDKTTAGDGTIRIGHGGTIVPPEPDRVKGFNAGEL